MLPHTHFLVAFLLGLVMRDFGYLNVKEAIIIGTLSALIDIDHLFSFYRRHKQWSIKGAWEAAIVKHEQEKSVIQHGKGFILMTIIFTILLVFLNKKIIVIVALAYYIHYILDHIHVRVIEQYKLKNMFGVRYPLNYYELMLNIVSILLIYFIL